MGVNVHLRSLAEGEAAVEGEGGGGEKNPEIYLYSPSSF